MITFDPKGGDLGRAMGRVTALEMQIIIPHVANILEELVKEELVSHDKKFKYAFELPVAEKDAAMFVIHSSSYSLPPHVFWYEIDGNHLFEMRGASGGIVASYICYLVTK